MQVDCIFQIKPTPLLGYQGYTGDIQGLYRGHIGLHEVLLGLYWVLLG